MHKKEQVEHKDIRIGRSGEIVESTFYTVAM